MSLSTLFVEHFSLLEDPRVDNHNKRHLLSDVLVITILAVICGAESWVDIHHFGKAKYEWLSTFLELPNGIPSHDTFGRVFAALNSEQLQKCFIEWINTLANMTENEIVAIDGKTVRRSFNKNKGAIHMVSAWAVQNSLVLGQIKTAEKSNEITAIPELLNMLDVEGATVTIDAMGCQQAIAEKILEKKADYVLALKANQPSLFDKVQELFVYAQHHDFKKLAHDYYEELDKGHGRIERRQYWLTAGRTSLESAETWPGLKSLGMVRATREINGQTTTETRLYLVSFSNDAKRFAQAVRQHWNVENNLHWSLDVSFHEDLCRVRVGHAAENFSVIRRLALNLLKNEKTLKVGIIAKRKRAGWDSDYLAKVLAVGKI
jgi:predicted transposase YbfD/YdcC